MHGTLLIQKKSLGKRWNGINKIIIMMSLGASFLLVSCHNKVNNNVGELTECSTSDKMSDEECLESIFNRWYASHIDKDYNLMRCFYSDSVIYFSDLYELDELIDHVRDYLSYNNYAVRVEKVNVTLMGGPNAVVIFNRIIADDFPPIPTVLRFSKENGNWKIIQEYPIF